jgi:thiol-disulfide isomerase/thioredoxin
MEEIHGFKSKKSFKNKKSYVGRSPSFPTIVETEADATELLKAVKQLQAMVLVITAEWCGACKRIKEELHQTLRSNTSSLFAANIDESKLSSAFNITPKQFPTFAVVKKGKVVGELSGLAELNAMTQPKNAKSVMKAISANKSLPSVPSAKSTANEEEEREEEPMNMSAIRIQPNANGRPASVTVEQTVTPDTWSAKLVSQTSVPGVGKSNSASQILPESMAADQATVTTSKRPGNRSVGGSLYGAMASTAYELAAPAILMGIASATLGTKRSKRTKRSKKGTRRR